MHELERSTAGDVGDERQIPKADIVKRLRDTPNWKKEPFNVSWKDLTDKYDRSPFEAADEIERLREENKRLRDEMETIRPVICDCTVEKHADGRTETRCGSAAMMRALKSPNAGNERTAD